MESRRGNNFQANKGGREVHPTKNKGGTRHQTWRGTVVLQKRFTSGRQLSEQPGLSHPEASLDDGSEVTEVLVVILSGLC